MESVLIDGQEYTDQVEYEAQPTFQPSSSSFVDLRNEQDLIILPKPCSNDDKIVESQQQLRQKQQQQQQQQDAQSKALLEATPAELQKRGVIGKKNFFQLFSQRLPFYLYYKPTKTRVSSHDHTVQHNDKAIADRLRLFTVKVIGVDPATVTLNDEGTAMSITDKILWNFEYDGAFYEKSELNHITVKMFAKALEMGICKSKSLQEGNKRVTDNHNITLYYEVCGTRITFQQFCMMTDIQWRKFQHSAQNNVSHKKTPKHLAQILDTAPPSELLALLRSTAEPATQQDLLLLSSHPSSSSNEKTTGSTKKRTRSLKADQNENTTTTTTTPLQKKHRQMTIKDSLDQNQLKNILVVLRESQAEFIDVLQQTQKHYQEILDETIEKLNQLIEKK